MFLTLFLLIYCNNNITVIKSKNDCDNVMYYDLIVLSSIWVCILEAHIIGQTTYIIVYPVRDLSVLKYSILVGLYEFLKKLASAKTSKLLVY